jgi:hypothetical protein
MNPVRDAINDVLTGDTELTTLATGGIHWQMAPSKRKPPLVIFSMSASNRTDRSFGDDGFRNEIYLVKGVGFADDAEAINERCEELLADVELSLASRSLRLAPMPEGAVSYVEETDGEEYSHEGTNYRVVTE